MRALLLLRGATKIFIIFNLVCDTALALKSLQIKVPRAVLAGSSVELSCTYDLEGAQLYSIRWYRQMVEFYRFVPKEAPATRVFEVDNINVDLSMSDEQRVALSNVTKGLTGEFQCEVSADAPLFHTDIKTAELIVVEPPNAGPNITADKMLYSGGDRIRSHCISPPSIPPANLTFFVNGQLVPGFNMVRFKNSTLVPTSSEADLVLEAAQLSPIPSLVISCEATIFDMWSAMSNTIVLKEKTANPYSALGRSLSGSPMVKSQLFLGLAALFTMGLLKHILYTSFCMR